MGKNLHNSSLVQRSEELAFFNVLTGGKGTTGITGTLTRMEGFTDLSNSQNPKEYSRQYVDEDFERTDIVGYAPAVAYSFDRYKGNTVLEDIVKITKNEYIGEKMVRFILLVDMTTCTGKGTPTQTARGKIRQYAVIPDSYGDTTDCMTYSGNFKARGWNTDCIVTSKNDWQTIDSISYDVGTESFTTSISLTLEDGSEVALEGGVGNAYTASVPNGSVVNFKIVADGSSSITVSEDLGTSFGSSGTGASPYFYSGNKITSGQHRFVITVNGADTSTVYAVTVTGE